ncbi:hypothetical protein FRC17_001790 [Serendipita sp. 399]|nr:hypothetical protein FRC17_001790 [Serendipita sp. 399]
MRLLLPLASLSTLSGLVSASAVDLSGAQLFDQSNAAAPIYVNALGQLVDPQRFEWGGPAIKELGAAGPRKLARAGIQQHVPERTTILAAQVILLFAAQKARVYAAARTNSALGTRPAAQMVKPVVVKRVAMPERSAVARIAAQADSFAPMDNVLLRTSISSIATPSSTPAETRAETGTTVVNATITRTETTLVSTTPISSTVPPSSTTTSGGGSGNGGGNNTPPGTIAGAVVGSVVGAGLLCCLAAFLIRRNRGTKPPEETPTGYGEKPPPAEQPPQQPYEAPAPNEGNTYVERPITGTPGIAGHGAGYT